MKKALFLLSLLATVLLTSCEDELNLIGEFKETAVVYAILDKSDSVHFIKITRAFIGPGNAYSIAQVPDSSYFDQVDATITEIVGGVEMRVWNLMDSIIEYKDEDGVFYAPKQRLYYFSTTSTAPLLTEEQSAKYRLDIVVNGGEIVITGETSLVDDMDILIANSQSTSNNAFTFATDVGVYTNTAVKVELTNAEVVNMQLKVDYTEFRATDTTNMSFKYTVGEQAVTSVGATSFNAKGSAFYEQLGKNLQENLDPSVNKRNLESITVIAVGAGHELNEYMINNQPSSNLTQSKPVWTNLSVISSANGANVIGVFSSRNTTEKKVNFVNSIPTFSCLKNIPSRQELCNGSYTSIGLFCSQFSPDASQSWYCN